MGRRGKKKSVIPMFPSFPSQPRRDSFRVLLEDRVPSAYKHFHDCDVVLWGMVEHVSKAQKAEQTGEHGGPATSTSMESGELGEFAQLDLPLSFGSTKTKKRKAEVVVTCQDLPRPPKTTATKVVGNVGFESCGSSNQWGSYVRTATHNLCMVHQDLLERDMNNGTAPVLGRILGNGKAEGTVLVRTLPGPLSEQRLVEMPRTSQSFCAVDNAEVFDVVYGSYNKDKGDVRHSECCALVLQHESQLYSSDSFSIESTHDVHPKYWDQRFRLFSRFDGPPHNLHSAAEPPLQAPCQLDAESWYSLTPESVAAHVCRKSALFLLAHAKRQRGKAMVNHASSPSSSPASGNAPFFIDCFSGCGGTLIPLARHVKSGQVWAVDLDPEKHRMAAHNAAVYSAGGSIKYVTDDVFNCLRQLPSLYLSEDTEKSPQKLSTESSPDLVMLSPPWGGPGYTQSAQFDIETMLPSGGGKEMIQLALSRCDHVVSVLPRNCSKTQLREAVVEAYQNLRLEKCESAPALDEDITPETYPYHIEDIYLYSKHKLTVLYAGPAFANLSKGAKKRTGTKNAVEATVEKNVSHIRFEEN